MPVEQGHGCQCQELGIQSPSEERACHTIEPHGVPWGGAEAERGMGKPLFWKLWGEVQALTGCLNDFSGFWATGLCWGGWGRWLVASRKNLGPVASSLKSKLSTNKAELVESGLEAPLEASCLLLLGKVKPGEGWSLQGRELQGTKASEYRKGRHGGHSSYENDLGELCVRCLAFIYFKWHNCDSILGAQELLARRGTKVQRDSVTPGRSHSTQMASRIAVAWSIPLCCAQHSRERRLLMPGQIF